MIQRPRGMTLLLLLCSLALLAGCSATYDPYPHDPGPNYPQGGGYHGQGPAGVPPGHLPPPGQCRIWYPGTPPGHQPPPGDCSRLSYEVPPGAWLVYGAHPSDRDYRLEAYHPDRPGLVWEIRWYDQNTGALIRVKEHGGGSGYYDDDRYDDRYDDDYGKKKWKNKHKGKGKKYND